MPTLPTYDTPQVSDRGTPSVRFENKGTVLGGSSGDIGQGVAKAAAGVVDTAHAFLLEQKKRADQVRVTEQKGVLAAKANDLLYNPDSGALNTKGKNALGIDQKVFEDYDKLTGEMEVELSGDYQRAEFQKARAEYREDLSRQLNRHMAKEADQYDDEVTKGFVSNERTAAALSFLDADRVSKSVANQEAEIRARGERKGMPKDLVDAQVREASSKTHVAVLTRMVTENMGPLAKDYFSKVRDSMDPEDAERIGKAINHSSVLAEAQLAAKDISSRHNNMAAALKDIDKLKDPEVQEKTKDLVKERFSLIEQGKKQYKDNLYEAMAKKMEQTRDIVAIQNDPTWQTLDSSQRTALESRYNHMVQGLDRSTNQKKFVEFLFLSQGQLASLSQSDYETNYRQHFSNADQGKADSDITSAKKGDEKNQLLSPFSSYKDRFDDILRAKNVVDASNPKKSDADAKKYSELALAARKRVEDFEQIDLAGKRRATGEEIQKILDDMVVKKVYVSKDWARDPEKEVAILTDEEKGQSYVPYASVPAAERNAIEKLFKKKPSRSQIERAYGAVVTKDRKRLQSILSE